MIAQEHYSGINPGEENEDLDEEIAELYARCREALNKIAANMAKDKIQRVADRAEREASNSCLTELKERLNKTLTGQK